MYFKTESLSSFNGDFYGRRIQNIQREEGKGLKWMIVIGEHLQCMINYCIGSLYNGRMCLAHMFALMLVPKSRTLVTYGT